MEKLNLYSIYLNSENPIEYRLVIDDDLNDYYMEKIEQNLYKNLRYVNMGFTDIYVQENSQIAIFDPRNIEDGRILNRDLIDQMSESKSILIFGPEECKEDILKIYIFAIFAPGQPNKYPVEYRVVLDKDRIKFYDDNSISEEENEKIMEQEDDETADENGIRTSRLY